MFGLQSKENCVVVIKLPVLAHTKICIGSLLKFIVEVIHLPEEQADQAIEWYLCNVSQR